MLKKYYCTMKIRWEAKFAWKLLKAIYLDKMIEKSREPKLFREKENICILTNLRVIKVFIWWGGFFGFLFYQYQVCWFFNYRKLFHGLLCVKSNLWKSKLNFFVKYLAFKKATYTEPPLPPITCSYLNSIREVGECWHSSGIRSDPKVNYKYLFS